MPENKIPELTAPGLHNVQRTTAPQNKAVSVSALAQSMFASPAGTAAPKATPTAASGQAKPASPAGTSAPKATPPAASGQAKPVSPAGTAAPKATPTAASGQAKPASPAGTAAPKATPTAASGQAQPGNSARTAAPMSAQRTSAKSPAVQSTADVAVSSEKEKSLLLPEPDVVLSGHSIVTSFERAYSCLPPRLKALLFILFVPTLLSLLYFILWASPMYIAEARFAVRGAEGSIDPGGLASMLLPAGMSVGTDANIVAEYIQSPDIMEEIDKDINIFNHFSSHDYDIISRLASDATRDERLTYWKWAVKPSLDPETGIIALSVKAYEPAMARKLAEAVLARSEALVNAMSRRAQDDAISLAMREVKTAENRVSKAQEAMRAFRERSGMLDPVTTAGGLQNIVSQLESEVVKVRAEIAEASTYMSKDAPTLIGLRARLAAVEKQLASEKLRLAGEAKPDSLTSFAGEYEDLQIESNFARQQLVSAMTSLEAARVKAEMQSRYVVAFQVPALPDESLYPRPLLFTLYVFVGVLVLAGLCSLIIAAVREHAGF